MIDVPEARIELETFIPSLPLDPQVEGDTLDIPTDTGSGSILDMGPESEMSLSGGVSAEELVAIMPADPSLDPGFVMNSDGSDTGPPIVVNGKRINYGGGGGGGGGSAFFAENDPMIVIEQMFNPDPGEATWPPIDEPDDYDPPKVAAEVTNPDNAPQVQAAAEKMTAIVDMLTEKINALDPNAVITLADGSTITGAQLQALWNTIDFVITDRTAADFGDGRNGALYRATGEAFINASYVNLMDSVPNGNAFVALHEVMHYSARGNEIDQQMWAAHVALNPNATDAELRALYNDNSPHFQENEEFANVSTRNVLAAPQFNIPIAGYWQPGSGYEYNNTNQ